MIVGVAFAVMLAVLAVVLVMQWQRARNPKPLDPSKAAQFVQGTLTLTGVSPRPEDGDKNGDRFGTVSGTIVGPQTSPTEVYSTLQFSDADPWPQIGQDLPVHYKPGKASTTWRLGALPSPPESFGNPAGFGPPPS